MRGIWVAGMVLAWGTAAWASPDHLASTMTTGATTSQPIGHYEFCKKNEDDCGIRSSATTPWKATAADWRQIESVNSAVNQRVRPRTDEDHYGRNEMWTYPDGEGDCEDYALEKRRVLMAAGIPASDLLMTVLRKPDGEGHAVLTVRTDRGDFVLDNLSAYVKIWSETDYTFVKRQSEYNSGRWVDIEQHDDTAVGSLK